MRRFIAMLLSLLTLASTSAQNAWTPILERADVYPTVRDAAESMVDEFTPQLRQNGYNANNARVVVAELRDERVGGANQAIMSESSTGSITVSAQTGPMVTNNVRNTAVVAAMARIQRNLRPVNVTRGGAKQTPVENEVCISIGIDNAEEISRSGVVNSKGYNGRLHATLVCRDFSESFEADFRNQQWVSDWQGFIRSQPSKNWIVGRSPGCYETVELAESAARADAAEQIMRKTQNRLVYGSGQVPRDAVVGAIASQIRQDGATDRFIQRIDGDSGSSWRAAVLVSSSDRAMTAVMPPFVKLQNSSSSSGSGSLSTAGSVAVMVFVIVLLYFFLNGATKGYFTWRLRIGAVALLLIGAAFLLLGSLFFVRSVLIPESMPAKAQIRR